jgi:hypothetical protein
MFGGNPLLSNRFEFTAKNRQGSAQFMRDVSGKAIDVLKGIVETRDHAVQGNGQSFDFITRMDERQAFLQVSVTKKFCLCGNLIEWLQGALHHPVTTRYGSGNYQWW